MVVMACSRPLIIRVMIRVQAQASADDHAVEQRPAEATGDRHRAEELGRRIRSAARSVLPEAVESKVAFTANARAIRHFLDIRGSILGDDEMRFVSALLLQAVRREAPAVFADFSVDEMDGVPLVRRTRTQSADLRDPVGNRT